MKGNIWVTISVGNDEKYWTGTSKPLLMSLISPFTEIANFGNPSQTIPTFSYNNGSFYVFLHNRILKGDRTGNFQELGTIPISDIFWSALVYNDCAIAQTYVSFKRFFKVYLKSWMGCLLLFNDSFESYKSNNIDLNIFVIH